METVRQIYNMSSQLDATTVRNVYIHNIIREKWMPLCSDATQPRDCVAQFLRWQSGLLAVIVLAATSFSALLWKGGMKCGPVGVGWQMKMGWEMAWNPNCIFMHHILVSYTKWRTMLSIRVLKAIFGFLFAFENSLQINYKFWSLCDINWLRFHQECWLRNAICKSLMFVLIIATANFITTWKRAKVMESHE